MPRRLLRWMVVLGLFLVISVSLLQIPGLIRPLGYEKASLILLVLEQRIADDPSKHPTGSNEANYESYRTTQLAYFKSDGVLKSVLSNPSIKKSMRLGILTEADLRDAIEFRAVPQSELIEVRVRGMSREDALLLVGSLVDAVVSTSMNQDFEIRQTRLERLEKLLERFKRDLQQKRESVRSLRGNYASQLPDIKDSDLSRQQNQADTLELDRLNLSRTGIEIRIKRIKASKDSNEGNRDALRKLEDDLAVADGQIELLTKRVSERDRVRKSDEIDLTRELEEIRLLEETAAKVGREVQDLEIQRSTSEPIPILRIVAP